MVWNYEVIDMDSKGEGFVIAINKCSVNGRNTTKLSPHGLDCVAADRSESTVS